MKTITYTDSQFALVQRALRFLEVIADFGESDREEIAHVRRVSATQAQEQTRA